MSFEEIIDSLIKQTKNEAKNIPPKRKLDLIFIAGLVEHLKYKANFITNIAHEGYTFKSLMINVENSFKEIEEVYEKKRKELGV